MRGRRQPWPVCGTAPGLDLRDGVRKEQIAAGQDEGCANAGHPVGRPCITIMVFS